MVDALHLGFMCKYILQIEELVNKKEIKIQYRVFFKKILTIPLHYGCLNVLSYFMVRAAE